MVWYKITKYQNNSIKITNRMKPFHKKVKMPHADSVTKNTNVMTMPCRMYSLYTSKIQVIKKVIDNYIQ